MKQKLYVTLITALLNLSLLAQTGFKGQVIDKITKEPLEAAVVEIKELNKNILTDKLGNFSIAYSNEKINLVITSKIGRAHV